jgi:hypothetical protein
MTKALLISFVMAVVLLASCEDMNGPGDIELVRLIGPDDTLPGRATLVVGAVRIRKPPFYAKWYRETEQCIGLNGDYQRLRFYTYTLPWIGGPRRFPENPKLRDVYVGQQWGDSTGKAVLSSLHLGHEGTVKHEMGHHILNLNGMRAANLAHDSTYFNARCLTR